MIVVYNRHPKLKFSRDDTVRTLTCVLKGEKVEKDFSISVVFGDNRIIRSINRKFFDQNYNTDVISFPLGEDAWPNGEIYVSLDMAKRQAKEFEVSFTQETRRLLIHGTLHLLGYDDRTRRGRAEMAKLEDHYLSLLNQ